MAGWALPLTRFQAQPARTKQSFIRRHHTGNKGAIARSSSFINHEDNTYEEGCCGGRNRAVAQTYHITPDLLVRRQNLPNFVSANEGSPSRGAFFLSCCW